ncbi:hypothetical protein QQF64_036453 [Cirrhinus molitorella]|uniref:DUF5641 domain-containing protein n=1 Tax=Cirrhinus molitorella TaxID=172907 RepID=A0ABR3NIQ8_9TELE
MFHRFHVSQEDRDYLRFLWWENGDTRSEPKEYRMKVHLFGAASSPGCANYGMKYLASQNEKKYPAAASFIKSNFYVDDGLISVKNVDSAIKLVEEARIQRWHAPRRNVKIGDIVIVKEEDLPRNEWRLGRVVDVCADGDGLVRKAKIQIGNRKLGKKGQRLTNPSILERPIHKLVVLVENK